MRKFFVMVFFCLIQGCTSSPEKSTNNQYTNCNNLESMSNADWIKKNLKVAKLHPLCQMESGSYGQYRFYYFGREYDFIVTLNKPWATIHHIRSGYWSKGRQFEPKLIEKNKIRLSKSTFTKFKNIINRTDFWNQMNQLEYEKDLLDKGLENVILTHNTYLVFESATSSGVNIIDRQGSDATKSMEQVSDFFTSILYLN